MIRPEVVPLIVVALLLIAAQPGVETVSTVVGGDRTLPDGADAVVVVDGAVTVPIDDTARTAVYVVGGSAHIDGTLEGELVQLAGTVTVGPSGAVTGRYQQFGGDLRAASGAAVEPEMIAEPLTRERTPAGSVLGFVLQAAILAAVSFLIGRRLPSLLGNVGDAVSHHPVVSGTVGLLAIVTLLALFVFMAFTIVLIPVSVLGLIAGIGVVLYAYVAIGYLVGRLVPDERPGVATAIGAVAVLVASRLIARVPLVGDSVVIAVTVVAVGAVLITYFGLRTFEPPTLEPVE